MADRLDNQWPLILRLLAAGGFTRGRVRSDGNDNVWPDDLPAAEVTWDGEQRTAVELPGGEQLLVRPAFWEWVVGLARSNRTSPAGGPSVAPPPNPDRLRRHMVAHLLRAGSLIDPLVARAMLQVPRHVFLPNEPLERAYADEAVITHKDGAINLSSASQPAMVAIMLEQLAIEPGMRVLEIGAGTGYNAALLAELVGPSGRVTTIDIGQDIVDEARKHLDTAGYRAVRTVCGDGAAGFLPDAPYDRIILTVGAYDIAPVWHNQLAEGGLLLLPLTLGNSDQSIAFERHGPVLRSRSAFACGFIRLRGLMAPPELQVVVDDGALVCIINEGQGIAVEAVVTALAMQPVATPMELPFKLERWHHGAAFSIFCAAHGDHLAQCVDRDGRFGPPGHTLMGLYAVTDNSIALIDLFEGQMWTFGDGAAVVLHQRLQDFVAAGLHQAGRLAVEAHAAGTLDAPPTGGWLLRRRYSDLVVFLNR